MSVSLLDVNVLLALFDPAHVNHDEAHDWFGANRRRGWATCPITINGFVRVLSNPGYPTPVGTAGAALSMIRTLCESAGHEFWADDVSLLDRELFRAEAIAGHQKITDIYLLGLAVRRQGKLITFDRSIGLKAVNGAQSGHLRVLGG